MTTRSAADAGAFLDRCHRGSGAAYEAFKELLERLDRSGGPDGTDGAPRRTDAGRRAVCWEGSSPAWSSTAIPTLSARRSTSPSAGCRPAPPPPARRTT